MKQFEVHYNSLLFFLSFQGLPRGDQQRDLRQDPERGRALARHVPAGPLHRHRRLRDLSLSVHCHAIDLFCLCPQEPLQVLVGTLPGLDDRIRHGFDVSLPVFFLFS